MVCSLTRKPCRTFRRRSWPRGRKACWNLWLNRVFPGDVLQSVCRAASEAWVELFLVLQGLRSQGKAVAQTGHLASVMGHLGLFILLSLNGLSLRQGRQGEPIHLRMVGRLTLRDKLACANAVAENGQHDVFCPVVLSLQTTLSPKYVRDGNHHVLHVKVRRYSSHFLHTLVEGEEADLADPLLIEDVEKLLGLLRRDLHAEQRILDLWSLAYVDELLTVEGSAAVRVRGLKNLLQELQLLEELTLKSAVLEILVR
mmetsp:Transcript_595/g.1210  ORF Transcript_595/g.1210 Transcript_595/m.1210 type:complete len:256 (-) Transcript_595:49-816(-)